MRAGRWKLAYVEPGHPSIEAIRAIEHADPGSGFRLYDLVNDPAEQRELTALELAVTTRLLEQHERWRSEVLGSDC